MMTLEEFEKSLPKPGEKVRYLAPPKWHFFTNVIENHSKLEVGKEYEVETCNPASSWTPLTLKEFGEDIWFTWDSFEKVS